MLCILFRIRLWISAYMTTLQSTVWLDQWGALLANRQSCDTCTVVLGNPILHDKHNEQSQIARSKFSCMHSHCA